MKLYSRLFVTILFIIPTIGIAATQGEVRPPNFLFIAVDDMNDWVGPLKGHPQAITPNLDMLAAKGVNFTQAYCPSPGCSPSRNAILYGREPFNTGWYAFYDDMSFHEAAKDSNVSLPRLLSESSYLTYGAGKVHHREFAPAWEWTDYLVEKPTRFRLDLGNGYQLGGQQKYSFCPTLNPMEELPDYQRAQYAIDVLSSSHESPFFLAVGFYRPHLPFICPQQFFDLYPESIKEPDILEGDLDDVPYVGRSMIKKKFDRAFKKDKAWSKVRRAYLACISWTDFNIGRVLEALEQSEYADNTIIILWSDHGYALGEKEHFTKFALWEDTTRVPFMLWDTRNGAAKGATFSDPVSLINIYRTVADYAGLAVPGEVDGFSLAPYLRTPDIVIDQPAIMTWGQGNYALRNSEYRYIRYYDGTEELYRHPNDPDEWQNLAGNPDYATVVEALQAYLPLDEAPLLREGAEAWSIPLSAARKH